MLPRAAARAAFDATAPPINFAINPPLAKWNGRALHSGVGGLGGQVITAPGSKASGRFDPDPASGSPGSGLRSFC